MAIIESEAQKSKTLLYRRVFNTPEGRQVLQDMLLDMNVFSSIPPTDPERMAIRNYGMTLLYNVGVMTDDNIELIVDRLMSIDYK